MILTLVAMLSMTTAFAEGETANSVNNVEAYELNVNMNKLRCLWKVGLPLQSKPGKLLSSRDDMGCMEFSQVAVLKLVFL